MKKIIISLVAATSLFAASSCDKVIEKIDSKITKAQSAKKVDNDKIKYLKEQKEQINKNCVDGKIDTKKLKSIKAEIKYKFDMKKLEQKQEKLNQQKAKIEEKYKKQLEK